MAQAIIEGKTKWFKALGEARDNKFKEGRSWSFQIAVGSAEKLLFRQNKVKKHVKFDEELGDYVTIDLQEFDKKGRPNKPIKVVDKDGNDWDADKWIGNLTTIKATVQLDPYKFTAKDGEKVEGCRLVPTKIEIIDHVPYVASGAKTATKTKRTDTNDWTDDE